MRIKLISVTAAISFGFSLAAMAADDKSAIAVSKADAMMTLFLKEPSEELLNQTYKACQAVPEDRTSPSWGEMKDAKFKLILKMLLAINATKDPNYKAPSFALPSANQKIPVAQISADSYVEGVEPGQDPDQIKDPQTKKKYLELLKKQTLETQRINLQSTLIKLQKNCLEYANELVWDLYGASEKDHWEKIVKDTVKDEATAKTTITQLGTY